MKRRTRGALEGDGEGLGGMDGAIFFFGFESVGKSHEISKEHWGLLEIFECLGEGKLDLFSDFDWSEFSF